VRACTPAAPDAARAPADDAVARGTYWVLAQVAAARVTAPVVLHRSAPAVSRDGAELTVAVTFDPSSRQFVASSSSSGHVQRVFVGPSLTLACAAASQALAERAPLCTLIRGFGTAQYRRTRPQYQHEVRFSATLARLGELACG
jgi:hypothetical protein